MEAQQKSLLRMLWLSFIGAVSIYLLIGYLILVQKNRPVVLDPGDLKEGLFLVAAIGSLALTVFARSFLPKMLKADGDRRVMSVKILQFAFSEIPGIFGLILFFFGGSFAQLTFLCLVALGSLAMLYPQE